MGRHQVITFISIISIICLLSLQTSISFNFGEIFCAKAKIIQSAPIKQVQIAVYPSTPDEYDKIQFQCFVTLESGSPSLISGVLSFKSSSDTNFQSIEMVLETSSDDNNGEEPDTQGILKVIIGSFNVGILEYNISVSYDEDIKWQSGQKQLEINKLVGLKIGAICITPEYITTADTIRVNTTIYGEELQNNSVLFHYRPSLTTYDVSMSAISKNEFEVIIGPFNEPGAVDYYVTAENTTGNLFQSLDYYFTVHILNASSNNGNNPFHIPGFILGPALLAIIIMSTIFLLWKKRKSNR